MKLTSAEKLIIKKLRDGGCINHNNKNFVISFGYENKIIQWRVWHSLVHENKLIHQGFAPHFEWNLSPLGKTIEI